MPNVWIVDDSPLEAQMARRALAGSCTVELFADGTSMLERLSGGGAPDIIVLDWQLPEMSGIEICRFLRTRADAVHVPVLLLTVHDDPALVVEGLSAGANDYLTKPYDAAELLARVESLLRARRSEARYRTLVDASSQVVWTAEPDGRTLIEGGAWHAFTGKPQPLWLDAVHGEDRPTTDAALATAVARGAALDVDFRVRRHDGACRHLHVRAAPVIEGGVVREWMGAASDVTERLRAERSLAFLASVTRTLGASLQMDQTLATLSNLAVPVLGDFCFVHLRGGEHHAVVDAPDDTSPLAAPHAQQARLVALKHEDAQLQGAFESALRVGGAPGAVQRVLDGGPAETSAALADLALGTLSAASTMTVPLDAAGRRFGAITYGTHDPHRTYDAIDLEVADDVARRGVVAIENARLFELAQQERLRAEEASRMKDEFLATLSHELRTPLNSILGWTRMLQTRSLDPDRAARALSTIERNAVAQTQLIEDMLDVSRIITGKLRLEVRPVDLAPVVESALDTIRPAADAKDIALQAELEPGVDVVHGDADRLLQVVANLLTNAVKFTPRGGRIHVRLSRNDRVAEVSVTDTGMGMSRHLLPHVFDRFRQGDGSATRTHGGLGLGLSIVRHLVELHGGTAHASSEGEGKGASFVVRIPFAPERPSGSPGRRPLEPHEAFECPPSLCGLRILVVDDEADARELMSSVLEACKASVETASSVAEALEVFRKRPPDMLLSDIGMPGEDGYALISRIRALSPDQGGRVPAIALTAYARAQDRTRALVLGYDMHVAKPIKPSELLVVLGNVATRLRPS